MLASRSLIVIGENARIPVGACARPEKTAARGAQYDVMVRRAAANQDVNAELPGEIGMESDTLVGEIGNRLQGLVEIA